MIEVYVPSIESDHSCTCMLLILICLFTIYRYGVGTVLIVWYSWYSFDYTNDRIRIFWISHTARYSLVKPQLLHPMFYWSACAKSGLCVWGSDVHCHYAFLNLFWNCSDSVAYFVFHFRFHFPYVVRYGSIKVQKWVYVIFLISYVL